MNDTSQLFKDLFCFDKDVNGFSEQEIQVTEQRLGIKLPQDLRLFYLTQVKNKLINSCHYFEAPDQLYIDQSDYLVFYGENQGIWAIAYNLKDGHIYINFEQMGYEKEAESLKDFFIIRAACDYCQYTYPFQIFSNDANTEDIAILLNHIPSLKSEINPTNYFHRRVFWETEDNVVQILQYAPQVYNGKILVHAMSQNEAFIHKIKNLKLQLNWEDIKENRLRSPEGIESYLKDS